jgi:hypothetical protein
LADEFANVIYDSFADIDKQDVTVDRCRFERRDTSHELCDDGGRRKGLVSAGQRVSHYNRILRPILNIRNFLIEGKPRPKQSLCFLVGACEHILDLI